MSISPKAIFIFLSSIVGVLFVVFMCIALNYENYDASLPGELVTLFNLNAEVSIPTWYSQSLLLIAAGLLFLIAKTTDTYKKSWYALSGILLFVSIDEGASIHELLTEPMRELLNISDGPLYYTWVVVYGMLFSVIALFFVRFFMRLPRKTRVLFATALSTFLLGAVGMEMLGALVVSQPDAQWMLYALTVGLEESFEMLGVAVFIYALLDYAARYTRTPRVIVAKWRVDNP